MGLTVAILHCDVFTLKANNYMLVSCAIVENLMLDVPRFYANFILNKFVSIK